MARFTGKTVSGGLLVLLGVVAAGGNVSQANENRRESLQAARREERKRAKAKAKAAALRAKREAKRAKLRSEREQRARDAQGALEACPICHRQDSERSAATVLFSMLNGGQGSKAGMVCNVHLTGEQFSTYGEVTWIDRNVNLTPEPGKRFYIAHKPLPHVALLHREAPKAEVIPTVYNSEAEDTGLCRVWCTSVYAKVFSVSKSTAGKHLRKLVKDGNATREPRQGNAEIAYKLVTGFSL
jgi:hypothetical protein